jgi:arylsulfatase A-like enzyme
MIRDRQWKYVHRYPYGPHELYNLVEDPGETANRAADPGCAETVRQYRARLGEWFGRHVDPALDGAREPVTGRGQIDRVGPGGQGRTAFV